MKKDIKKQRKQFVILLVCIVTGFIISYSYNLTKKDKVAENASYVYQTSSTYEEELIVQQERNNELQAELEGLEEKIRTYEQQYNSQDPNYEKNLQQADTIRLLTGEVASKGKGIRVTLNDGEYDGKSNPNNYVVHESHIFSLLQELKIAGAEAIAINGQRLKVNSYVNCNGPVITVDGRQYPAPFIIEAIGEPKTMVSALKIPGGFVDQIISENVFIELSEEKEIEMPAVGQGNS